MTTTLHDFKAQLFRALANPLRIRILEELRAAGSLTVTELHQRTAAEPANVSQHLGVLRANGLVATQRDGTSVWYRVVDEGIFDLLDVSRDIFTRQLDARQLLLTSEMESSRRPSGRPA